MKESIRMIKSSNKLDENNRNIRENKRNEKNLKNNIFLTCIKCLKLVLKNLLMLKLTQ